MKTIFCMYVCIMTFSLMILMQLQASVLHDKRSFMAVASKELISLPLYKQQKRLKEISDAFDRKTSVQSNAKPASLQTKKWVEAALKKYNISGCYFVQEDTTGFWYASHISKIGPEGFSLPPIITLSKCDDSSKTFQLLHEIGHYANRDLEGPKVSFKEGQIQELLADIFACQKLMQTKTVGPLVNWIGYQFSKIDRERVRALNRGSVYDFKQPYHNSTHPTPWERVSCALPYFRACTFEKGMLPLEYVEKFYASATAQQFAHYLS